MKPEEDEFVKRRIKRIKNQYNTKKPKRQHAIDDSTSMSYFKLI